MNSDINYIIQMSLNGDKNYQKILLEKLNPLLYKNIYIYLRPGDLRIEDMVQEGYAVILQALKTYDKEKNVHFLQHVKTCVKYFYKNLYKKNKALNNELSSSENMVATGFKLEKNMESTFSILDFIIKKEEKYRLLTSIEKLNEKEQRIIYLYYYEELTLSEISKLMILPYQTVASKKRSALKKLKRLLEV